jgi:hypothetical protein
MDFPLCILYILKISGVSNFQLSMPLSNTKFTFKKRFFYIKINCHEIFRASIICTVKQLLVLFITNSSARIKLDPSL